LEHSRAIEIYNNALTKVFNALLQSTNDVIMTINSPRVLWDAVWTRAVYFWNIRLWFGLTAEKLCNVLEASLPVSLYHSSLSFLQPEMYCLVTVELRAN